MTRRLTVLELEALITAACDYEAGEAFPDVDGIAGEKLLVALGTGLDKLRAMKARRLKGKAP